MPVTPFAVTLSIKVKSSVFTPLICMRSIESKPSRISAFLPVGLVPDLPVRGLVRNWSDLMMIRSE